MKDKVDPVVDEAIETLNMKDGPARRKLLKGAGLFSATAAASALISACSSSSTSSAGSAKAVAGNFPSTPKWQFWFVNHVTTNQFFTPTQYGMADAAALVGLPTPKWGGSETSTVSQMTTYMSTAVSAKADGIAVAVIDPNAFKGPIENAMNAGIPVLSYNADGSFAERPGGHRLEPAGLRGAGAVHLRPADGGEDPLPRAGRRRHRHLHRHPGLRQHPAPLRRRGRGAQGQGRLQHRRGGHRRADRPGAVRDQGLPARPQVPQGRVRGGRGLDRVPRHPAEGGRPEIPNGGFDTTGSSLPNIKAGLTDFVIYQDPYLQGFLPVIYTYLFNLSGGTIVPPDTDTGLSFIEKASLGNYQVSSRFQGQTTAQKYIKRPAGAIQNAQATTST